MSWKFLNGLFLGVILSMAWMVVYASARGFDFSDEALYLMGYRFPGEVKIFCTFFFQWVGNLPGIGSAGILELRILRLILHLLSAFVFSAGFYFWFKNKIPKQSTSPGFILLLVSNMAYSLLSYSIFPQSLSYNSLTLIFLQFSVGVICFLKGGVKHQTTGLLLIFSMGFLVASLFLIKATSGILFFLLLPFLLLDKLNAIILRIWLNWKGICIFSGGVLFAFWLVFGNLDNLFTGMSGFYDCLTNTKGYGLGTILYVFYKDASRMVVYFLESSFILIPSFLYFLLSKFLTTEVPFKSLWIPLQTLLLFWFSSSSDLISGGTPHASTIIIPHLLLMISLVIFSLAGKLRMPLFLPLIFMLVPIVGAFGSIHPPSVQFVYYLSFLGPSVWVSFVNSPVFQRRDAFLVSGAFIFIAFSQIYSGLIKYPYLAGGPAYTLRASVSGFKGGEGVLVQPSSKKALDEINNLLKENGFNDGDLIFTFFGEMGMTYLLNGISPGIAPFTPEHPDFILDVLSRVEKDKLKTMFFLVDTIADFNDEIKVGMVSFGINIDEDYVVSGPINYFSPKDHQNKMLYLFSPKRKENFIH